MTYVEEAYRISNSRRLRNYSLEPEWKFKTSEIYDVSMLLMKSVQLYGFGQRGFLYARVILQARHVQQS